MTLKVALIGLGDIARKAYLPTLGARPGLDLHLMTRDRAKLDTLGDTYRVGRDRRFTSLDELLLRPLDAAFVHASTDQHVAIVGHLLDAGVPTYVDKPLDSSLGGAQTLADRSAMTRTPLMVGFNRRYAPAYVQSLERPRDLIVLHKNQTADLAAPRETVYDDFIHVVDTLRFLAPGTVELTAVSGHVHDGKLHHVVLTLIGQRFTAIGIMHRASGGKLERLELTGAGGRQEITDLTDVLDGRTRRPADGWAPVARQRGIEQICTAFLDSVRTGTFPDLRDALRTHELCEHIVRQLET